MSSRCATLGGLKHPTLPRAGNIFQISAVVTDSPHGSAGQSKNGCTAVDRVTFVDLEGPMRRFAAAFLAIAVLGILPGRSGAAGPLKTPSAMPPSSWTGYYIGANGGYGWGHQIVSISGTPPFDAFVGADIDPTIAADPKGFLGGLQAGYNYQFNAALVGVETDLDWSDITRNQTDIHTSALDPGTLFTTSGEQKLDMFGTVRGRLGWALDNWLVYATAGLAYGHASLSTVTGSTIGGVFCSAGGFSDCTTGSSSRMLTGSVWGAGVEWHFTNRWSAKAEYLYYNLGSISFISANALNPLNPFHSSVEFRGDIVRAGLNYSFGGL
jgi:outer membrane immunogenic protein